MCRVWAMAWLFLLPKRFAGRILAKKIAPLVDGTVRYEKGKRPSCEVVGTYRDRDVRIRINLMWGYFSIRLLTQEQRRIELCFRLEWDKHGKRVHESELAHSDDESETKSFVSDHVALTWTKDSIDAGKLLQNAGRLQDAMIAAVNRRTCWSFAYTELKFLPHDWVFWRLDPVKMVQEKLDLAVEAIEAIEA